MPLDPELTLEYMRGFLGYGNPDAKWWFIGLEEGGGKSEAEVSARMTAWRDWGGRKPFLDLPTFSGRVGHEIDAWFKPDSKLQSTWGPLIRVMLRAQGHDDTDHAVITEQRNKWGTTSGDTCLTEVLPLPALNSHTWCYPAWSALRQVQSRSREWTFVRKKSGRSKAITEHLSKSAPASGRVFLIYTQNKGYREWLGATIGSCASKFCPIGRHDVLIQTFGNSIACIVRHPTGRKRSNAQYWEEAASLIIDEAKRARIAIA